MARRRKPVEEHDNHERWMVSFADFITLLFAFFVVMYATSSPDAGKFRVVTETLSDVFAAPSRVEVPSADDQADPADATENAPEAVDAAAEQWLEQIQFQDPTIAPETVKAISEITHQLMQAFTTDIEQGNIVITQGEDWIEVDIKSNLLFASGEARLSFEAVPIIREVADILSQGTNPIQVEGFTDNIPINTPTFPSNWELSAARAASVVNLLERFGLEPTRLSAIGYGEHKPIADNDTEDGRQDNRRVVLVIIGSPEARRSMDAFRARLN